VSEKCSPITLEKRLHKRQIPYSLKKGERQIEPSSIFGKVLDLAIRLRLNPKSGFDGEKLCAALKIQLPWSWGADGLLHEFAKVACTSDIQFPELQTKLLDSIQDIDLGQPNITKFCEPFKKLIEGLTVEPSLKEDGELERSLQELQDFKKSWIIFKRKGWGYSLSAFRNAMALGQLVDDYDPSSLTLSTAHTMKGVEKDIVFL
jgi:DNA helicase-2/ATP-dependent DNA helicase PcrA